MATTQTPARLKQRYLDEIRPALVEKFGYTSAMQAPKIEKITVNMGVGDGKQDSKVLDAAAAQGVREGVVLGLGTMAYIARLTRSSMLEVKRQDFVRTARAKGLANRNVISAHMLRNALIPIVTILGPAAADLVTGSIIIESIFGAPGLGREFVESISKRDYSVIMGTAIFYAVLVALANVAVDLSYGLVDPRIRVQR